MKPMNVKALIFAHRGASAYAPENTLESFKLALAQGADGIELDVHLTADGQLAVIHDRKIDRTSNGQGAVSEYTLSELRTMDFGYHFYAHRRNGIKIPTLEEVYALVSPFGTTVNVELKSADPRIIKACSDVAERYGMKDRIIYSSFDHFQLRRMKELDPCAFIAPLYEINMLEPWKYCAYIGAGAVHPDIRQIRATENYVERCHECGLRVNAWTADAEEDICFLLDVGADGIITNHPDIAIKLRDERMA